jgi:hypothetical protein
MGELVRELKQCLSSGDFYDSPLRQGSAVWAELSRKSACIQVVYACFERAHLVPRLEELLVNAFHFDIHRKSEALQFSGLSKMHAEVDHGVLCHFFFALLLGYGLDSAEKAGCT